MNRKLIALATGIALGALVLASAACSGSSDSKTTLGPQISDLNPPEFPAVTSMRGEHAGAGAVTVFVTTSVATHATFSVIGENEGAAIADVPTVTHGTLLKEHTVSVATGGGPVRVTVKATDANGAYATGSLEIGGILGKQFWARKEYAPKLTMAGNGTAMVTWLNLKPGPGDPTHGSALLFMKPAGCTTAQACEVTEGPTIENDIPTVSNDQALETHVLTVKFPDWSHDYELVLVGAPAPSVREFYQLDVRANSIK